MDALGIFEFGAKAGRAYVCAIRQAWAEAFAEAYKDRPADPQSDYYASRLGVAEEGGEALEPAEDRYTTASMHALIDARWCGEHGTTWGFCKHKPHGITPVWIDQPAAAPTVEPRMESDGPDASQPLAPTPSDMCHSCGHTLYVHALTFCDVASHYEVDDCLCSGFRLAAAPKVPSSSAGRGVGSPGVSAGAEDPAPSGERPTPGEFAAVAVREVLAEHHPWEGAGGIECSPESADFEQPYSADHLLHFADKHDWREHVATEIQRRIDAAVGATPTPKPAEAEAASTFEQHRKTK